MAITAQNICEVALGNILNDDPSQPHIAADLNTCLLALQVLCDHWQLDPQATIGLQESIYTPPVGTQTVTVGTGGNINIPMPPRIEASSFCRISGADSRIGWAASFEDYTSMPVKSIQGYPSSCFYMPSNTNLGTLYLYPASNGAELHIWTRQTPLNGFASITLGTALTLPMGLQKTLIDALCVEILDSFLVSEQTGARLALKAANSMRKWKRANIEIRTLNMPAGVSRVGQGKFVS